MIKTIAHHTFWKSHALLVARFLMGGVFIMASVFKFHDIALTVSYIAQFGFPAPLFLAWVAAIFEIVLGLAIITGIYFEEAALLLAVYAVFLGVVFHGPSTWVSNQNEFGFFIDHLVMFAGLLYMAAHGAGNTWKLKKFW